MEKKLIILKFNTLQVKKYDFCLKIRQTFQYSIICIVPKYRFVFSESKVWENENMILVRD